MTTEKNDQNNNSYTKWLYESTTIHSGYYDNFTKLKKSSSSELLQNVHDEAIFIPFIKFTVMLILIRFQAKHKLWSSIRGRKVPKTPGEIKKILMNIQGSGFINF